MQNPTAPAAADKVACPLDEVVAFLDRFVIFPSNEARDIVALWIIHTWAFDAAYTTPYIYINSPEKQSGKTRVIETAEVLARNPYTSASVSAASMPRIIETTRPTLFVDEVDTVFTGEKNEILRNILNSGYKHNGTVTRVVPAGPDDPTGGVRTFSTFAPKLMAGIETGQMPDTIADRCITITLQRKKKDQEVERFMARKVEAEAKELKIRIEAWVSQNMDHLVGAEPKIIDELSDRAWDIMEPLIAIAERCKGWGPRARRAAKVMLSKSESPLSPQAQVLAHARNLFVETGRDTITSAALQERTDLTSKQIGVYLNKYGITSKNIRVGSNQSKGYRLREMQDAFDRYLAD